MEGAGEKNEVSYNHTFVYVYTHIVMHIKFSFREAKEEEEVGVSTRRLPVYTFRILTFIERRHL